VYTHQRSDSEYIVIYTYTCTEYYNIPILCYDIIYYKCLKQMKLYDIIPQTIIKDVVI